MGTRTFSQSQSPVKKRGPADEIEGDALGGMSSLDPEPCLGCLTGGLGELPLR